MDHLKHWRAEDLMWAMFSHQQHGGVHATAMGYTVFEYELFF
jgi:hypothetical protein